MINKSGLLNDQPYTVGLLLNMPMGINPTDIHQIWFSQPGGSSYHRGGNYQGWSGNSWKLFSQGTANAAQVLSGYTFSSANGSNISGTMVNQGAKTSTLNYGGSYTIPAGYHNGSGKITANSLSSQTSATATAAQILSGKTAYVNGSKITGTMTNRGALNWSGSNTTYTVPAGYYSGGTLNSKTSYTNGYNAGVTAADNRANTSSTNYKTGYNAGYSAGVSNLTCVTANGTSGGAQTVDASVTTPSGKTHCHICAAITNPRIANTYVQKGGSTVSWTKTETSRANIFYAHITGLSSGTVINVHSQRQNTSTATLIGVVALFG